MGGRNVRKTEKKKKQKNIRQREREKKYITNTRERARTYARVKLNKGKRKKERNAIEIIWNIHFFRYSMRDATVGSILSTRAQQSFTIFSS